ncbi:YcnI family copper-binding membrane protein [Paenibacillus nasutitermitis]|uniref:YncI copper-binding domain-containing protein n=1 Tax=Paenibacillus nasutitermitis TaxID=1652958 RepID=A0A916YKG5_9BACL|nr:YcnI family protein [Paenibacillus nasutitermitis]GGD48906.1 hypothetical protein GCM10010911_03040 [Paenibacillus nasutitermitis]
MSMRKKWSTAFAAMLSLFLFAGLASAHVSVQPQQTTQGSYEVFTVRVPSEAENVTTKKVQVKVPDSAAVSRVQPKPGWKIELEKTADNAVTSITWTAEGNGLAQTEFDEFRFQGKVADDAKELLWKAYQTYSDNSVVEWVGAAGSDYPASVTTVTAGTGEGDGHGAAAPAAGNDAADEAGTPDADSGDNTVTLWLAIAALAISIITLISVLSRRKKA